MKCLQSLTILALGCALVQATNIYLRCRIPDCYAITDDYKRQECEKVCIISNLTAAMDDYFDYGYQLQQYETIRFEGPFSSIPVGTFNIMPNVKKLDISFSGIDGISSDDFNGARNLKSLIASHNKITELPENVFVNANELHTIDLSHNEIVHISPDAFPWRNEELSFIDLSNNRIQKVESNSFTRFSSLQSVSFANNDLQSIELNLFQSQYIESIDFSNNLLLSVDCDAFRNVPFAITLNLSGNSLAEFRPNCFQFEEDISYDQFKGLSFANIDLSYTRITEMNIPESTRFQTQKLWLRDTATFNLHKFFRHFEKLLYLDLSGSVIGRLNVTTFTKLSNLKELYLSGCNLKHITFGTFSSQTSLQILDMSYNNIKHIDFNAFWPGLTNIQEVRVKGNQLMEIDGLTRDMFPKLAKLDITENYFQCLTVIRIVKEIGWPINQQIYDLNTPHVNGIPCIDPYIFE